MKSFQHYNKFMPYLSSHPLSKFVEYQAFKERPLLALAYPVLHIAGMAGYAFALAYRITCLVLELLLILLGIICLHRGLKNLWREFGHHVTTLISGVMGLSCPILGYRMDEWLQKKFHITFAMEEIACCCANRSIFIANPLVRSHEREQKKCRALNLR